MAGQGAVLPPMPPQALPPGHLEWHAALVALSPAVLAGLGTGCAACFGSGPRARLAGLLLVLLALVLEASFLLPGGLAAASSFVLGRGWVRLGTGQVATSLAAGCWIAVARRPAPGAGRSLAAWGGWIGLALALPLTVCPLLVVMPVWRAPPSGARPWRRLLAVAVLVAATGLAAWLRHPDQPDPWGPRLAAVAGCLIALPAVDGRWRPALLLALLALLLPLPRDPL